MHSYNRKYALPIITRVLFPRVTGILAQIQWYLASLIQLVCQCAPRNMTLNVDCLAEDGTSFTPKRSNFRNPSAF